MANSHCLGLRWLKIPELVGRQRRQSFYEMFRTLKVYHWKSLSARTHNRDRNPTLNRAYEEGKGRMDPFPLPGGGCHEQSVTFNTINMKRPRVCNQLASVPPLQNNTVPKDMLPTQADRKPSSSFQ